MPNDTSETLKPLQARRFARPQCGVLDRFSFDDRRSLMFEDLLPDLGQVVYAYFDQAIER